MKLLYTGILSVGCLISGYFMGKSSNAGAVNENERYSIAITDSTAELKAHHLDKAYTIKTLNEEVYLGDAQHNFNGATALTFDEAKKFANNTYESLEIKITE